MLDIILPGLSGYRVLEQLRAAGVDTPVLLLSAKDGEFDQADGLDLGADGYLVKPFSFVVLVAQLRAMLRRRDVSLGRDGSGSGSARWSSTRSPARSLGRGRRWSSRPREYALLHALASRPGTAVAKDELLRQVWGTSRRPAATSSRSTSGTCGASWTRWGPGTSCARCAATDISSVRRDHPDL